jgi:hypothetical protein
MGRHSERQKGRARRGSRPSLAGRGLLAVAGAVLLAACGGSGGAAKPDIVGLQTFSGLSRNHVTTAVDYPQIPPVGGDHFPAPQTCGAYDQPIHNELGVHSMEHGAVWITYRPDLPPAAVDRLRREARQSYVLVSPYPDLPAPVVASAWGLQVRLDSAEDSRLDQFVTRFRNGPQTPEPGAACTGQGFPLPLP